MMSLSGLGYGSASSLYGPQSQLNASLSNLNTPSALGGSPTLGGASASGNPLSDLNAATGGSPTGANGNILGMLVQIMSLMVSMLSQLIGGGQGGGSPIGGSAPPVSNFAADPTGGSPAPSPDPSAVTPSPAPSAGPTPSPASGSTSGANGASEPPPSGDVGQWISQAQQALAASGVPADKMNAQDIATIIQHESSGDPNAINLTDQNAKDGHPSIGLMQTIQSTFDANKLPGHDDIRNPVDNIIAAVRYAVNTYGSVSNVPGIKQVKSGGEYVGY